MIDEAELELVSKDLLWNSDNGDSARAIFGRPGMTRSDYLSSSAAEPDSLFCTTSRHSCIAESFLS